MKAILLSFIAVFLFANESEYIYALKLYYDQNSSNDKEAITLLKKVANEKNVDAAFLLAVAYSEGNIVLKDQNRALYWYQEAAKLGDRDAMMFAGWIYYQKKEYHRAKEWFEKAYKKGDKEALEMLNLINDLLSGNW